MDDAEKLDELFRKAVSAIDAGDVGSLGGLLDAYPELVRVRLEFPGVWLRDKVGEALDGFFRCPYLLWFVAEDPIRNGKLPKNIVDVAGRIIAAAKRAGVDNLQEQLDYALRLVCWSCVARECGVQIGLLDLLIDAGASVDGRALYKGRFGTQCDAAIYNQNFAAAEHLVERGAPLTLTTALCLGHWTDVERLVSTAKPEEIADAFMQAARGGRTEALRRMLALGVDAATIGTAGPSHATSLHHAVWSGTLEAVKVLVEAGADLNRRDTIYGGTPLGWAEYAEPQQKEEFRKKQYRDIAAYLRERGGK